MQRGEQKTRKGPKMPTPEQIQMMRDYQKEHEKLMKTDPEYRKNWEKQNANGSSFFKNSFFKTTANIFLKNNLTYDTIFLNFSF